MIVFPAGIAFVLQYIRCYIGSNVDLKKYEETVKIKAFL